jgi:hypothetical protein
LMGDVIGANDFCPKCKKHLAHNRFPASDTPGKSDFEHEAL